MRSYNGATGITLHRTRTEVTGITYMKRGYGTNIIDFMRVTRVQNVTLLHARNEDAGCYVTVAEFWSERTRSATCMQYQSIYCSGPVSS